MIVILAIIGFSAVAFAAVYFPYRRSINAWFGRRGYRENRNLVAAAVVVAVVVAVVAIGSFSQKKIPEDSLGAGLLEQIQKYNLDIGSELPSLVLPDTAGAEVDLSQFRDQTLVLSFWNTWCKYCARQLPELQDLVQESSGQAKVFLINMNESAETVKKYKADQKINLDMLVDEAGTVSGLFRIQGTPTNVFVRRGVICAQIPGAMDKDAIISALEDCLLAPAPAGD